MIQTTRTFALGLALSSALLGQNYQSSFANISYDRAKSPAGFHGDVAVDAATGAVSMELPLGPGIGRGGLRYVPRLSSRFAPTLQARALDVAFVDAPPFLWWDVRASFEATLLAYSSVRNDMLLSSAGGASLSPGYLSLKCNPIGRGETLSHFTLPDGSSSSICGEVPSGVDAAKVLADFQVNSPTLASMPRRQGQAALSSLAMGAEGELVIALAGRNGAALGVITERVGGSNTNWLLPARVLVIRGDIAYEFGFVHPLFFDLVVPLPRTTARPDGKRATYLQSGYYLLTRMSDRFGESLVFNHFHQPSYLPDYTPAGYTKPANVKGNGINLDVVWARGGNALGNGVLSIRSSVGSLQQPAVVCLQGAYISQQSGTQKLTTTVSYSGMPHSSYSVESYPAEWGGPLVRDPDVPANKEYWGPTALVDDTWDHLRRNLQPIKITQTATGDAIRLSYVVGPTVAHPFVPSGVHSPTVLDTVSFPGRSVKLNWVPYPWRPNAVTEGRIGFMPGGPIDSPSYAYGVHSVLETASDAATRSTTYNRTVPQPDWRSSSQGGQGGWTSSGFHTAINHPDGHVTVTRYFEAPSLTNGSAGTGPDKEEHVRTLGFLKHAVKEIRHYAVGANWEADLGSAPGSGSSAYRIETFDQWSIRRLGNRTEIIGQSIVPKPTRTQVWDSSTGTLTYSETDSWSSNYQDWANQKKLVFGPGTGFSSSGYRTTTVSSPPAGHLYDRSHSRTLSANFAHWLPSLPSSEQTTGRPPTNFSYYPDSPLLSAATVAGAGQSLTTSFSYESGSSRLSTVRLSGAGLAGSGTYGFDYGYDDLGHLSSIKPAGVTWNWSQSSDALGQVTGQTDPNGLTTSFSWDQAGRITNINPPGELGTVISYPSSFTARVTRGSELSENNYDGFGQLVRTHRSDGGSLSHKCFDYDPGGRKRAETPWLAGAGSNTEAISTGSSWTWDYDGRGRLKTSVAPSGTARVTTEFTYIDGLAGGFSQRTATVFGDGENPAQVTTFTSNALGLLTQVTDALGQSTSYSYDAADRFRESVQTGVSGTQVRTWTLNDLGWLTSLSQPESGTTSYSAFTVTGKPTLTTYGDGAVEVKTTYDDLMRPTSIQSTRVPSGVPAVNQGFTYDTGQGVNLKGKLTKSSDGIVTLDRTYDGSGRLYSLKSTLSPSGESAAAYLQTYQYDSYGRRTHATVDGRTVQTSLVAATGQASSVSHRGSTFAHVSAFDATTWLPTSLAYDRTGSRSDFQYAADQVSLAGLAHYPSGIGSPLRQWIYSYDVQGRLRGDGEDAWTYDPLNRLRTATFKPLTAAPRTITQTFDYDAFGNPLSSTGAQVGDPASLINFAFQTTDERLQKNQIPVTSGTGTTGATYDSRGNLTAIFPKVGDSANAIGMAYDALGRVSSMTYHQGSDLMVETYFYSAEGLRHRIETRRNGILQKSQHRLYDDQRRLVSEYEAVYVAE